MNTLYVGLACSAAVLINGESESVSVTPRIAEIIKCQCSRQKCYHANNIDAKDSHTHI